MIWARLDRHLGDLGGMIVRPRATLRRLAERPPRFESLLPWFLVVTATADPERVGHALLLTRIAPIDGLLLLVQVVFSRFGPAVLAVFLLALVLSALRQGQHSYDVWSSLLGFCLVPLLLLSSLGGGLSALGLDLWFLPHHRPDLGSGVGGVRALVAYGWPLVLAGMALRFARATPAVAVLEPRA